MKRYLSKHKSGLKAICIVALVLICLFAIFYIIFFNTTHFSFSKPGETVDNNLRNVETGNDFITVANGYIFLSYRGSMFKSGVYEISPPLAKSILKGDYSSSDLPSVPGVNFVYNDKPLERFTTLDDENKITVNSLIDSDPIISFDNSKYNVHGYFTFENEIYFQNVDKTTVYRYDNGKMEVVVSEELCGQGFIPLQYYKGDLYFCHKKDQTDYSSAPMKLYQYSLSEKKIIRQLDLSPMEEVYRQHQWDIEYLICDDCIYFNCFGSESGTYLYRYDFDKKTAVKLLCVDAYVNCFNAFGNTAYIATKSSDEDNECLYALTNKSDEPKILRKGRYNGVAIIDKQWVYLVEQNEHIYRISTDGEEYQKVF